MLAFFVLQQFDDLRGGDDAKFAGAEFACFALDFALDVIYHAARGFYHAAPSAGGAGFAQEACQRFAGAFAGELKQAELRKIAQHGFDAVALQLFA